MCCSGFQIEGVIADYNLTLGDLIGTLKAFFQRLGIEDITFKPAYNPYTEPSMEVFAHHKELDKVVEIGNSGTPKGCCCCCCCCCSVCVCV